MDDKRMNRRQFFRDGLRQLLQPMVESIAQPLEEAARQFNRAAEASQRQQQKKRTPLPQLWLRPPGSQSETHFVDTCSRCGTCANVCPVQAIRLDKTGADGKGVPYLDADLQACAMCEELACMRNCPSGALVPTPRERIDIGKAVFSADLCLRTSGEECRLCVEACPVGLSALELIDSRVTVHPLACTGCGMCQQACPTAPRAITVIPRAARDPSAFPGTAPR